MKERLKLKKSIAKVLLAAMTVTTVVSGCSKKKQEINMTDSGEIVTVESLKAQVDELTAKVNSMQETMDRYYAGSKEGEQKPSFSLDDVSYDVAEFDDRVLVVLKNNGTEPVIGLKVLATFCDAGNNVIGSKENFVEITTPGAVSVAEIDYFDMNFSGRSDYDHVDIQLSKENYSFTRNFLPADNFSVETNQTDGKDLAVKVTNQGDVDADMIQITAVFYKSGAIVGYNTNSMINVQTGMYDSKMLYGAYAYQEDGSTEKADYDSYEVYLSSIYNY